MTQRYGGEFSPSGKPESENKSSKTTDTAQQQSAAPILLSKQGKRRHKWGLYTLSFFSFIFAFSAFFKAPYYMLFGLAGFASLSFSFFLTKEGLKAEDDYDSRKVARRPPLPRKILGSIVFGLGLMLVGISKNAGFDIGLVYALVGGILHSISFGIDPLMHKSATGVDAFQHSRVAQAIAEAENKLLIMNAAIAKINDRALTRQVENFSAAARQMFRSIEDDPRDLSSARKYIGVYLNAAKDVTLKFSELYPKDKKVETKQEYEKLIIDLTQNFEARVKTLLDDDHTDLDVEITVLQDRLKRENLVIENSSPRKLEE